MVHGCIHGCEAPTFLDGLDQQKELLDSHVVHLRHCQRARGTQPADVEGERLL